MPLIQHCLNHDLLDCPDELDSSDLQFCQGYPVIILIMARDSPDCPDELDSSDLHQNQGNPIIILIMVQTFFVSPCPVPPMIPSSAVRICRSIHLEQHGMKIHDSRRQVH
jgi:hypothetical protein